MLILTQFLFRLAFGLALSMAITSPRLVTSGYFRNHLYVLLGMNVLAALVAWQAPEQFSIWPPLAGAVLSYAGAVAWLYEKPTVGRALLALVAIMGLLGAWLATPAAISAAADSPISTALHWLDAPTSGLLLGSTLAAMFLGHWYLNTPTMELAPLELLVVLAGTATAARAIVCGAGLAMQIEQAGMPQPAFIALRWLSGLIGAGLLFVMTWKTLKIPNTQSATGILYVAVIAVFLGELTSQLLSAHALFPL
jgi:hypothetical protein